MGSRIAGRLLDAGHDVYGTNRTKAKAEPLIERGLQWCETPSQVAAAADVVFSMVTDDAALRAITSGLDGILAGLEAGKVYVDMSTVSPRTTRHLAQRVAALGAQMSTGRSPEHPPGGERTLAIFVGGSDQAFVTVAPLLRELVKPSPTSAPTSRLLLKLAVNISLAVQTLASARVAARRARRASPRGSPPRP